MMKRITRWTRAGKLATSALAMILAGCGSSEDETGSDPTGVGSDGGTGDAGGGADGVKTADLTCDVVVSDTDCDQSQRPFVFVHGTFGFGANFANVAALLGSNGFCQDRIIAVEYNSLGDDPTADGSIEAAVGQILEETGFDQVDLAGHSQGTGHCGSFLADPARAAKVANYINYSGSPDVGDVTTLSLSSQMDLGRTPRHATGTNVTEVTFQDEDHFAVASSKNAFIETYRFLTGAEPEYTTIQCGDEMVTIEGVAESFADNVPQRGKVELRKIGETPRDTSSEPIILEGSTDGSFGPLELERGVYYEWKGFDDTGALIGNVYISPFVRSDRLVRLLTPPDQASLRALSTDFITRGPDHASWVVLWTGGAFRQDLGGSLTVDGQEVLTSETAGEAALATAALDGGTVGLFLYDADENGQSDLGLVNSAPFIAMTDVFIDASEPRFVEAIFTAGSEDDSVVDRKLFVPNWPSDEALNLLFFQ